ncbi:conserved hypothetical protein [Mucor ambiguus]|uniref:Carbon-nitrogen hydrolase n=1 Tax=Mucor ambiguus TaxID=91626 RepID=A0A0C9LWI0_9FUNG|nr:conserved hypothetical protein [Mucor ambiguus]
MSTGAEKYKSLKVKELQELLTKSGLPHTGKKEELIERLVKHDEKQDKELASLDDEFGDLDEFDESKVNLDDLTESVKPIEDLSTEIEDIDEALKQPETTTAETKQPETSAASAETPAAIAPTTTTTNATSASSEPIVKPNSNFKFTPITFDKPTSTSPTTTKASTTAPAATAKAPASPRQPIADVADAKVKSIDDAEKALERAKRFGIQLNEKAKKDIRAQRFGIANKAAAVASPEQKKTTGIDPEVLKKRAERFGISNTAATVASSKGKVPVKLDAAEEEKKRKRAERFAANKKQKADYNSSIIEACCQFDPKWGQVEENMQTASTLLETYKKGDIDILLLPEMAFTGYVFKDLQEISPFLEDCETGPSVMWAKTQAIRLECFVIVGYPQKTDQCNYNSICCVDPKGRLLHTYQKAFLYETDENWAEEGPGFVSTDIEGIGKVGFGICMDINPYRFKSDFYACEFANYHVQEKTEIILCSMAWLKSRDDPVSSTIRYWATRLLPLYHKAESGKHTIFVACNRIGSERGSEFAGASCVLDITDEHITILNNLKRNTGVLLVEVKAT